MSVLEDILDKLKEELSTKINPVDSNYTSSISEVVRGYCMFHDIVNKPFVWFTVREDGVNEETFASTGTNQIMEIDILLECIMNSEGLGVHTKMHAMLRDVKYFLKHDFYYRDNTYFLRVRPSESGSTADLCGFQMDIKIVYEEEL